MTQYEAEQVRKGSRVQWQGRLYTVEAVTTPGLAGPYFRLNGLEGGMVSYKTCTVTDTDAQVQQGDPHAHTTPHP